MATPPPEPFGLTSPDPKPPKPTRRTRSGRTMTQVGKTNRQIGLAMEAAIKRASDDYFHHDGSCIVDRCHPPFVHIPGVGQRPGAKQGSDLAGCHRGGQAIYLEAKSCQERLELRDGTGHLSDSQRAFLVTRATVGADVRLIVHFAVVRETYAMPLVAGGSLILFLAAPWRKSINVDMARAWGLLVPDGRDATGDVDKEGRPKKARYIRWLDGRPHPLTTAAMAAVALDERRAPAPLEEF